MLLLKTDASMSQIQQTTAQNRLLKTLSSADFRLLAPDLTEVETQLRQVLIAPDQPFQHLYFMEVGFASIVAGGASDKVEVGMIGPEGVVGASCLILDSDRNPHEHFIQVPGRALRIEARAMSDALSKSPTLHRVLSRYVFTELVQSRQTAFVNATFAIETRLARWLLLCHDRAGSDEFAVTHEFLSVMLGVHRSGVTLALQNLEGSGRIRAKRGRIQILSRDRLIDVADGSYGTTEAEYDRLIPGA